MNQNLSPEEIESINCNFIEDVISCIVKRCRNELKDKYVPTIDISRISEHILTIDNRPVYILKYHPKLISFGKGYVIIISTKDEDKYIVSNDEPNSVAEILLEEVEEKDFPCESDKESEEDTDEESCEYDEECESLISSSELNKNEYN